MPDPDTTINKRGTELWIHQPRGPCVEVSIGPANGIWLEIEERGDRAHVNLTRDEARAVAMHILELVNAE
jgi:hypothetical protein